VCLLRKPLLRSILELAVRLETSFEGLKKVKEGTYCCNIMNFVSMFPRRDFFQTRLEKIASRAFAAPIQVEDLTTLNSGLQILKWIRGISPLHFALCSDLSVFIDSCFCQTRYYARDYYR
jgi:hypothetical protein